MANVTKPQSSLPMFAPKMTADVTTALWQRRSSRWMLFGGCLFWLCVLYIYIAWLLCKAAIWLTIIACIWAAQLLVLLAYSPWMVAHLVHRRRPLHEGG